MYELLTDKQKELVTVAGSPATHILAVGGSRSGKTFGITYCVGTRAIMAPGSRHLIGRLHNIDVRQAVMLDTWPAMMKRMYPHVPYQINKQDQYAVLPNESEVWFSGFDDKERVEKILGKEFATWYANECSQLPFDTILTLRTRLAQNVMKASGKPLALKAYYDLNPVGRSHWTYLEFVKNVRPDNRQPIDPSTRAWLIMNPDDNPHLPSAYIAELDSLPERQRQRFRLGQYQSDVPGSLWPIDTIDACRISRPDDVVGWARENMGRIVVGVDPSGSDGYGGNSQGIVVVGQRRGDKHMCVLEDATCELSPAGWGDRVAKVYHKWGADCVVVETNFGGEMAVHTIRTADPRINVKKVTASRGKHVRAEPIAALYENRADKPATAHHVGVFPDLEDQMAACTTDGYQGMGSPDRMDALVWAGSEITQGIVHVTTSRELML